MSSQQLGIPFHHFGGSGQILHFAHANGYPPEVYQQFIEPFLNNYEVIASKYRPLWGNRQPKEVKDWQTFAEDMIRFLDERNLKDIIGMGHSMGGTISALVAHQRPDLFQRLILIDPVILPKKYILFSKLMPHSFLRKWMPPAKISAKRKYLWDSREAVYASWRKKGVFKRFSDKSLKEFIDIAIVPNGEGQVTLAYSREWETQVYLTAPYVFSKLLQLKTPITVVRAEKTTVISPELWQEWQSKQPNTQFIDFKDAGHLVPLEYPTELANRLL